MRLDNSMSNRRFHGNTLYLESSKSFHSSFLNTLQTVIKKVSYEQFNSDILSHTTAVPLLLKLGYSFIQSFSTRPLRLLYILTNLHHESFMLFNMI